MSDQTVLETDLSTRVRKTAAAVRDVAAGLCRWPLWTALGWFDVKQKYRRAVLGPFWITISMGVLVVSLGVIYAGLFRQDVNVLLPHIAAGFIVWSLIATTLTESASAFISAEGFIKHGGLPLSLHVFRVLYRNVIAAAHNLAVMVLVYVWQPHLLTSNLALLPLGVLLVVCALLPVSAITAILGTRFRDLPPIIASVLQVLLFVSPIMYDPDALPASLRLLTNLNPITYLVEAVRSPLLGTAPTAGTYLVLASLSSLAGFAAFTLFRQTRARIAYWL
jgi:ABC-type polysaccharide/polyol phosphate export permease